MNFDNRLLYRELKARSRIAYTRGPGIDNDPDAFQVTVDIAEQGGGALIRIHAVFPSLEARNGVKFGAVEMGQQSWGKLTAWVEKHAG